MHSEPNSTALPRKLLSTLLSKNEAHRNNEGGLHRRAAFSRRVETHPLGGFHRGLVEAVAEPGDHARADHLSGFVQRDFDTHAAFDAGSASVIGVRRFHEALSLGLDQVIGAIARAS